MSTIIESPSASSTGTSARASAASRRLASLVEELHERDVRHLAEHAERRPGLWLGLMTVSAVALAHVAVVVAVPTAFGW